MDISDKLALSQTLKDLSNRFGSPNPAHTRDYLAGGMRDFSADDSGLPPLYRYMVAASSYLRQPDTSLFYDMAAAGRAIVSLRLLHRAIIATATKVKNVDSRVEKMKTARTLDNVDSSVLELVAGETYLRSAAGAEVEFVVETSKAQTPEFLVKRVGHPELAVECKRFARQSRIASETRRYLDQVGRAVLSEYRARRVSIVIELSLTAPLARGMETELISKVRAMCKQSLAGGCTVEGDGARVLCQLAPAPDLSQYFLYPSPKYLSQQYSYVEGEIWNDIVLDIEAAWEGPSFLDAVYWEGAMKWRVLDEETRWRLAKFGYDRIVEGMRQLAGYSHAVLHIAYERNTSIGHRRDYLLKTLDRMAERSIFPRWMVFNETLLYGSVGGRWDFQEHAHQVSRAEEPLAPPVGNVYVGSEDLRGPSGPENFGIGLSLPSIDTEYR